MQMLELNNKGISLTELIIASIMVGIIMIGIFSIDYAIRGTRNTASDDAVLAMQTWATVTHIVDNAKLAVGDANNTGMRANAGSNFLCFRQDLPGTPDTYADDTWRCYSQFTNGIHTCTHAASGATGSGGAAACQSADTSIGTFATRQSCSVNCDLFNYSVVMDDTTLEIYLDISITNRLEPTTAVNPLTNPDYTVETRVYPEGHSF